MQIVLQFSNQDELNKELLRLAKAMFKKLSREEFMQIISEEITKKSEKIDDIVFKQLKEVVKQKLSYNNMYFEVVDMIKEAMKQEIANEVKSQIGPEVKKVTTELITKQAKKILKME